MNYTDDELDTIEQMAGLFFKPEEIALVLEIDPDDFSAEIKIGDNEASKRFNKGWLSSDIELRKSVYESATNGSNPAQIMMFELNKNNKNA